MTESSLAKESDTSAPCTQACEDPGLPSSDLLEQIDAGNRDKRQTSESPFGAQTPPHRSPQPCLPHLPSAPGRQGPTVASRREGGPEKSEDLGPPSPAGLPKAGPAGEREGDSRENPPTGAPPPQPPCPGPQLRLLTPSPAPLLLPLAPLPGLVGMELRDPDHRGVTTGDHWTTEPHPQTPPQT